MKKIIAMAVLSASVSTADADAYVNAEYAQPFNGKSVFGAFSFGKRTWLSQRKIKKKSFRVRHIRRDIKPAMKNRKRIFIALKRKPNHRRTPLTPITKKPVPLQEVVTNPLDVIPLPFNSLLIQPLPLTPKGIFSRIPLWWNREKK